MQQSRAVYARILAAADIAEVCNFISEITIRILLGAAVEPNNLPALKHAELGEVVAPAIDFSDALHVWLLGLERAW
jgi:hypothetical protein